ncbi:MAG: phosphoserine phosphatase SerB, partial [Verrucomicrobiota bacterium]
IAEAGAARRLDVAFVPRSRRLADVRVVAMDMDSTLITIECIDEIADFAGVKPQVAAVTEAAMRGELDFPSALRQRVALLKGLPETTLRRVFEERLRLSPGAKALLETAQRMGLKTLLVSGGFTYFVERLGRELGIDHTLANQLEFNGGHLTGQVLGDIVDATAKATKLTSVCAQLGCSTREAVVFGDGANDLKMMALGGFSVAFRAKPVVRQQATVALNVCGLDGVLNWIEP